MMKIEKMAVIGAGVMGSAIAAQAANAGVPVLLLDIVPEGATDRNMVAKNALKKLQETDPPPLMHRKNLARITPGNIEDDLEKLAETDWIVEAVIEKPDIKHRLYRNLDSVRKSGSVVSSNTSTLPLAELTRDMPENFRRDFLITHFFNPPRYMRLLEIVYGPETRPDALAALVDFGDRRLGKSIVHCNDTPGFIANRIGIFWLQLGLLEALRLGLTVEKADTVISHPFGIPKTGIFGLLDLVGLDLVPHIVPGMDRALPPNDPFHAISQVPELVTRMIAEGYTGRKGKGGFYRLNRSGGDRIKEALDLQTGAYRVSTKPELASIAAMKTAGLTGLLQSVDKTAEYARSVMTQTLAYAAAVAPDVADDLESVDRAMRLGYNWQYGPFELIDRIGDENLVRMLEAMGKPVPDLLRHDGPLYQVVDGRLHGLAFTGTGGTKPTLRAVNRPPGVLLLADVKRRSKPLTKNPSASLWDVGDGVVCLEFQSKMNTFDPLVLKLVHKAVDIVRSDYRALVIYNEADNFSAGANLGVLLFGVNIALWPEVENMVKQGQEAFKALEYAPFPVVGAPSGMALGGGCEILLHCDAVQAHAELYMGLVEAGVGVTPGWGGCKEMLLRAFADKKSPQGPMAPVARVFETVSVATVSKSAQEAKDLLFLRPTDGITMNRDRLLFDAKEKALALSESYAPPEPPVFYLPGPSGKAALDMAIGQYRRLGKATAHDAVVAGALADVLTGGDTDISKPLSEDDLLALERRAFMDLVKRKETIARMEHMLETGKPLRN
jgi:3-hydroxyacyl-CoA dehydrogenase